MVMLEALLARSTMDMFLRENQLILPHTTCYQRAIFVDVCIMYTHEFTPPAGLEPAIFGLEIRRLVH